MNFAPFLVVPYLKQISIANSNDYHISDPLLKMPKPLLWSIRKQILTISHQTSITGSKILEMTAFMILIIVTSTNVFDLMITHLSMTYRIYMDLSKYM